LNRSGADYFAYREHFSPSAETAAHDAENGAHGNEKVSLPRRAGRLDETASCPSKTLEEQPNAAPLTTDQAVINASVVMVKALASQIRTTLAAIKEFDAQIEALCQAHEDFELFAGLPGAGRIYASRLLTAMGSNRERWASADELLRFSGVAPVIERSGKSSWTRWRYFCPKFLRQSFHEYAGESIKHSFWARAFYDEQRARGKSHQAAVRALAFKWIRIIYKCWKTRTAYDEVKYLEGRCKKGSSLLNYAANNPA
jgi:hypothetical protein